MKKLIWLFLIIICAGIFTTSAPPIAYAESLQDKLQDEVDKGINDLIGGDVEDFFNSIDNSNKNKFGTSIKKYVERIVKGETFNINDFLSIIWSAISANLFSILTGLISIVVLSILYALSSNLSSGFSRESTNQVVYYAIYGAIIATLGILINNAILSAKGAIGSVSKLVEVSFPIMVTVITALGGVSSTAVFQPVVYVFTSIIVKIINIAIMPMFYSTIVFGIIGNLTNNVKLDKLIKAIKSIASWTLGIMFSVVITLVTAQGLVGASIDNVSIRSARFALSSYVPILGGYLSDGFDIIMASGVLIKNAMGLTGIILLMLIIISPIIKILILMLGLRLTAGIIEPMGGGRISSLLYSTSKSLSILISVILGMAFLVFVMFMLIISTCNMGV